MRRRGWIPLGLLLGIILSGCAASPNAGSTNSEALLGTPFQIENGKLVTLKPDNIQVTFTGVSEDSRCPSGLQCAWAGQAVIGIMVSPTGGGPGDAQLTLGGSKAGSDTASFGLYRVQFQGLNPEPIADAKTNPADYIATLVITKK